MDTFHISDYVTFASLIALGIFIYTQIQGVRKELSNGLDRVERKVDSIGGDLKDVKADVSDLKEAKAYQEGYAKAKAELASK